MNSRTNLEKLKSVDSKSISGWAKKAEWRKVNESWLDESFRIGMEILDALRAQNMSQRDLADKLGVSAQQVNKIVKGTENLTLETKHSLERALGVKLGSNRAYRSELDKAQFINGFYERIRKSAQSFGSSLNYRNTISKFDESGLKAA
jgi:transcriptional regulator with XRE-family HTH domain